MLTTFRIRAISTIFEAFRMNFNSLRYEKDSSPGHRIIACFLRFLQ